MKLSFQPPQPKRSRELVPLTETDLVKVSALQVRLQVLLDAKETVFLQTKRDSNYLFQVAPARFYLCLDFDASVDERSVIQLTFTERNTKHTFRARLLSSPDGIDACLYLLGEYVARSGQIIVHEVINFETGKKRKTDSTVFRQAVQELREELEPRVKAELEAKWQAIIARDLLQIAQAELDRKKVETEQRIQELLGNGRLDLYPPNQEELTKFLFEDC